MKTSTTALAAILVLAGCAGQQSSPANVVSAEPATASPAPMSVLLTDTGCTSTPGGIAAVNGGTNVWSLRNQSASLVNFQLLRVEDDAFDQLDAFFRGSPVPEASQPSEGLPFVEEELQIVTVGPGDESLLTAELGTGVYGIACIVLDEEQHIATAYLTGPFSVADA